MAIEHALTIISWHENLPKDDVPPEYLWEDPDGLEKWWATVEDRRDEGFTGGSDDDDDPGMNENDLARYLKS